MPKEVERALAREARKEHITGKRAKRYIYGTMERLGWKPRARRKKKK